MHPADSHSEIDRAIKAAVDAYRCEMAEINESEEIEPYLPATKKFSCALLDIQADTLLPRCDKVEEFQQVLVDVIMPDVIEALGPHRDLERIVDNWSDETRTLSRSIVHLVELDLLLEQCGPESYKLTGFETQRVYGKLGLL